MFVYVKYITFIIKCFFFKKKRMFLFIILCFYTIPYQSVGCTFQNYNFAESLNNGWTIDQVNPTPYIDQNQNLILGDLTTEHAGNSSVYQDFVISSCNQRLIINYSPVTKDFKVANDQQYVLIKNPSNGVTIASVLATLLGFNLSYGQKWFQINCNVCDRTCGKVNLTALAISPLRLELKVHQSGNTNSMGQTTPTALIVKDVCLQ
jgi:hypothetical protein